MTRVWVFGGAARTTELTHEAHHANRKLAALVPTIRLGGADSGASHRLGCLSECLASASVQECCTIPIGCLMPSETTYTSLRENLASVLDQVVDQQETVIVRRRGARDVALLPATERAGLMETAHLLRSPRNARRLQSALRRAEQGRTKPGTAAGLRREILGEARS